MPDVPDVPEGFELWTGNDDPERCSFCERADDNLLFLDGWDPDDPGTPILVCDSCMGWGHRTQLAAGYAVEDI
jgi:hypothetical protein